MTTFTITPEIVRFAEAVRVALADLPRDEVRLRRRWHRFECVPAVSNLDDYRKMDNWSLIEAPKWTLPDRLS